MGLVSLCSVQLATFKQLLIKNGFAEQRTATHTLATWYDQPQSIFLIIYLFGQHTYVFPGALLSCSPQFPWVVILWVIFSAATSGRAFAAFARLPELQNIFRLRSSADSFLQVSFSAHLPIFLRPGISGSRNFMGKRYNTNISRGCMLFQIIYY